MFNFEMHLQELYDVLWQMYMYKILIGVLYDSNYTFLGSFYMVGPGEGACYLRSFAVASGSAPGWYRDNIVCSKILSLLQQGDF
jgi:hypothetical protein